MTTAITRFPLVTGRLDNDRIDQAFWAGDAVFHQEHNYFEVNVSLFDKPWYLSPNFKRPNTYTIYRKMRLDGERVVFSVPIGRAEFADRFKSLIQLIVPMWNPQYKTYLCLRDSIH